MMRFTLLKNLQRESLMKNILSGLLLFIFLYVLSDIFVKQSTLGLSVESINTTLFGNEEEFLDPMNKAYFLEFWHMEIFFMMMALLTLSAVFIRIASINKRNTFVLHAVMIFALSDLLCIAASYFFSSVFVLPYIISFFLWHLLALYMIVSSLWGLYYDTSL